jgi:hypothetical protein
VDEPLGSIELELKYPSFIFAEFPASCLIKMHVMLLPSATVAVVCFRQLSVVRRSALGNGGKSVGGKALGGGGVVVVVLFET